MIDLVNQKRTVNDLDSKQAPGESILIVSEAMAWVGESRCFSTFCVGRLKGSFHSKTRQKTKQQQQASSGFGRVSVFGHVASRASSLFCTPL